MELLQEFGEWGEEAELLANGDVEGRSETLVLVERHVPRCTPFPGHKLALGQRGAVLFFPHTSFPAGSGSPTYPLGKPLPALPRC